MAKRKRKTPKLIKPVRWGNPPKNSSFLPLFILILSGAVYFNLSHTPTSTPQISVIEESTCESLTDQDSCENTEFCAWVNDSLGERCVTLEY